MREAGFGAYAHQDLPFEKLVEELQPERDLSRNPLFQVMFVLQNAPNSMLNFTRLTSRRLEIDSGTSKFDLTLSLTEQDRKLVGSFEYSTDLFDHPTIERMVGHFQTLLEGIVGDPDQRISDLPILTEAERRRLLFEWNNTEADYPKDKCIHELFEEQVKQTPDAIAVTFEGQTIDLSGIKHESQSTGASLTKTGRWARTNSWNLPGAISGNGYWAVGNSQGRRGVFAVGPELSQRAIGVHVGGFRGFGAAHAGTLN